MRVQGKAIGAGDILITPRGERLRVDSFSPGAGVVWGHEVNREGVRISDKLMEGPAASLRWPT
jgi:hypothetical protein